jgi:aspartyl/asparaginyl beta-hydroxylase (cupin superfamily)|tara:strand:- start:238 stop:732 length:495 start_codon:yes stop_codon:yes gene_type:complete
MHIEVLEEIDHKTILEEINDVKILLRKGWKDLEQVGLQSIKPDMKWQDQWDKSINSLNKLQYPETYFKYPLFDLPNTNRLLEKYGMVRTRIMVSKPGTNLSFHNDLTKRIHIPLITTTDSIMIIEDAIYRLEPGKVYLTNTTLQHTAVNASNSIRVHVVGCVYS